MNIDEVEDSYQLSPMQQGMLFNSFYAPHSGVDIEQIIISLPEKMNVSAFRRSWQNVMERHAVLRTAFSLHGSEEPMQYVYKQVALPFDEHDWQDLARIEVERRIENFLLDDRRRGFNLAMAPLMRLVLLRIDESDYRFIWTLHHSLLDGRSFMIILKEVFSLYDALCDGHDVMIKRPRPYRDYIEWLRKQDVGRSRAYWQEMLDGFNSAGPLSLDRACLMKTIAGHGRQAKCLSLSLTVGLQLFAEQNQLTLNTLMQGAWALLLGCYTGSNDLVFGAVRACRKSAIEDMEAMVGIFINTLPVRVLLDPEKPLLQWLKEIRLSWIELRQHEHTPLVMIQELTGSTHRNPLFESILVFEKYSLNTFLKTECGSWGDRKCSIHRQTNFPLSIGIFAEDELSIEMNYDKSRFDDNTITRLLNNMETLLCNMIMYPARPLSEIQILSEAERQMMLVEWNREKTDFPQDICIHHLFEQWAVRTPEETAVVFEEKRLTYQQLSHRANRLAISLLQQGIGPEDLIGICVERSLEMVIGVMGILKAGAAYVPLDPAYPLERISFMLNDAQVRVLLVHEQTAPLLKDLKVKMIFINADLDGGAEEEESASFVSVSPDNLAYVIYTSGSTGRPKGVMISHRNVVGFLYSYKQVTRDGEKRIGTMVAPFSFDTSVEEMFSTLCFGGALHIVRPEQSADAEYFADYLINHRITTAYIVPDLLREVAGYLEKKKDQLNLRCLITGLAPKKQQVLQRFRDLSEGLRILNAYGPTEVTYGATAFEFIAASEPDRDVPIGRPFPNYEVYIVDSQINPVPVGVCGELLISGVGLSRGYRNLPDLTAEKFICNPFSRDPGAKLYRTGDMCCYLPDGNIEFLGRLDDQVKIRGFRIEPGEIESVLNQHADIAQAVVIAREDQAGDKTLAAYIVPKNKHVLLTALRRFLKEQLPSYMLPSAFVMLDALPLMPNGKIDRKALPLPDFSKRSSEEDLVLPRTPTEEMISGIWSEVLDREKIGMHDDFFALGGHSLRAVQVIARINKAFGANISLRSFFEAPTIAGLSSLLQDICWQVQGRDLNKNRPEEYTVGEL